MSEWLAEYCWNSTVWNLKLIETVPLFCSRIYRQIEARDRLFWTKKTHWGFQPYSANLSDKELAKRCCYSSNVLPIQSQPIQSKLHINVLSLRGWRNTVWNLNELFLFRKADHGPRFADICAKKEGYGFNELGISNSTISTVFRQPLRKIGSSQRGV